MDEVKMVQLIIAISSVVIALLSLSGYVEAQDWVVDDLYRDTTRLLILNKTAIDLKFKKESNEIEYKERENSKRRPR